MRRAEVNPAFVGSLALHLTVLAALLISWRFTHDLKIGSAVPVTIVANAPQTDLRAAEQAPQAQAAMTEQPQPQAPPEVAPPPQPAPKPTPAPPKPEPKPAPAPTPAPKTPKAPPKPEKSLDLDALAASLAKSTSRSPPKPSSAARGPSRAETALEARPDAGQGLAAAAINGLAAELQRRWNPNCEVRGGRDVLVKVTFELDAGGGVEGDVGSQVLRGAGSVAQVAATRAVSAVYAAAPFRNLPREFYGQRISVNFNAREACS
jgi:outer membrane biosynthesis protein TonB